MEIDDEAAASFAALGVMVPEYARKEDQGFQVWDINWPAFSLFLQMETQWRVAATPAGLFHLGIDYAAAAALLNLRSRRSRRRGQALLGDLRLMERVALETFDRMRD